MKKVTILTLIAAICLSFHANGQTRGEALMNEARENLDKKEYIRARYLYLQAWQALTRENRMDEAVACGIQATALYHRENLYQEGFDLLKRVEASIPAETASGEARTALLRYPVTKERMRMYMKMNRSSKAKEQLDRLGELATASGYDSLKSDLLYTKAVYYYTFGMTPQGDEALKALTSQYGGQAGYDKIKECYYTLIDVGRKANSARMVARAYDSFIAWNDSAKAAAAKERYETLDAKYKEALATIQEKDDTISGKQYFIIALCILLAIFAAALLLCAMTLLRFVVLSRKQKKRITELCELDNLKTGFIRNIAARMQPALQHFDSETPPVKAISNYLSHIQEMSILEDTITEPYEMKEVNVAAFCEQLAEQVRHQIQPEVTLCVDAPRISVPMNAEAMTRLLGHLLTNAARHTPAGGKITIGFKKRGAHIHQFTVKDTGPGIPEEKRAHLFMPFATEKDLMQGDGLGLPICALIARKMNGTLSLDTDYTKGALFVIELLA